MKKLLLMMAAAMITSLAFAQKMNEKDVPAEVKVAFTEQFTGATATKWEKEKGQYEVEFVWNKKEQWALFDERGNLVETEVEVLLTDLPQGVLAYMKTHYVSEKIKEATRITNGKGVVTYEVEIKGKDLIFDSNGRFVEEEAVKEKED
ncbi:MAG: PepSY-like domain-containing protein [Bacteroidota bacterium]